MLQNQDDIKYIDNNKTFSNNKITAGLLPIYTKICLQVRAWRRYNLGIFALINKVQQKHKQSQR